MIYLIFIPFHSNRIESFRIVRISFPFSLIFFFLFLFLPLNQVIRENWNLKYSACFVLCPVTAPDITVPYAVSVVSRLRNPPGNVLLVRNTDDDVDLVNTTHITNIPDKIGVCVKPFHFDYDSVRMHSLNVVCFHQHK